MKENAFFWVPLNNETGSSVVVDPLYKDTGPGGVTLVNHHYQVMIVDINNQLRFNMSEWTDAVIAQPLIRVSSKTFNLAWSVNLVCDFYSPSPPPTSSPSNNPTSLIVTLTPSSEPTMQPSASSNENTTTTTTPSPTITPSDSPSETPTNTTTGDGGGGGNTRSHVAAPIVGMIALVMVVVCVFFCIYRSKERAHKKKMESSVSNFSDNENAISMTALNTSDGEDTTDSSVKHVDKSIWVNDDMLSEIPLEKQQHDDSIIGRFINSNLTTKRNQYHQTI
jgi:hypothetical protein